MSSFYSNYRGPSLGRLLYFWRNYVPYHLAEHACFGNGKITYPHGNIIAFYNWSDQFGHGDVPVFSLPDSGSLNDYDLLNDSDLQHLLSNQEQKCQSLIEEALYFRPALGAEENLLREPHLRESKKAQKERAAKIAKELRDSTLYNALLVEYNTETKEWAFQP